MNPILEVFCNSKPIPQPRERSRCVPTGGFTKNGKPKYRAQQYTPQDHPVWQWKLIVRTDVQLAMRAAQIVSPLECPLCVDLVFAFPRPATRTRKTTPNLRYWLAQTPDKDNLEKAVFDGLNGVIWKDDRLIVDGRTKSFVCGDGDAEGVAIRVSEADELIESWADTMIRSDQYQTSFF